MSELKLVLRKKEKENSPAAVNTAAGQPRLVVRNKTTGAVSPAAQEAGSRKLVVRKTQSGMQDTAQGLNDLMGNVSSFLNTVSTDYTNRQGKYQNSDAFGRYKTDTLAKANGYAARIAQYRNDLTGGRADYEAAYGAQTVANALKWLDDAEGYLGTVRSSLDDEGAYWENFTDEAAYNRHVTVDRFAQKDPEELRKELTHVQNEKEHWRNKANWLVSGEASKEAALVSQGAIDEAWERYDLYNEWEQELQQAIRMAENRVTDGRYAGQDLDSLRAELTTAQQNRARALERAQYLGSGAAGRQGERVTQADIDAAWAEHDRLAKQENELKQVVERRFPTWYADLQQEADFAGLSKADHGVTDETYRAVNGLSGDNVVADYDDPERGKKLKAAKYENMTAAEVGTYNYIYKKIGAEEAQDYLDRLEETVNSRAGKKTAENIQNIDSGVLRWGATMGHAVGAGVDSFAQGVKQNFRLDPLPTSATQYASQELAKNQSGFNRFLYLGLNTVGNMLPSILLSKMTGGLGGATLGKVTGAGTMGLSASGNAYKQAMLEGYDGKQAQTYSMLVGASEATLQYLIGGIGALGGVSDDVLLAKAAKLDKWYKRMAATGAIKIGSEITEEELQLFLEPAIKSIVMDVPYDAPNFDEMLETALVTALSTFMLEGKSVVQSGLAKLQTTDGTVEKPAAPVKTGVEPVTVEGKKETAVPEVGTAGEERTAVQATKSSFVPELLLNLNQARVRFIEYAQAHFPKTVINAETGKEIGISRKGLDKFLSGRIGAEKYATGFKIPELIERAHLVASADNSHPEQVGSIPTYEYYDSPVDIDGVPYTAHIRVRNTNMGDRYYGHTISEIDEMEIEPSARTSVSDEPTVQPVNAIDDSIHNTTVTQKAPGVNNEDVRDMATPAESQIYNWGIKKDAPLGGAGRGQNRIPGGASSDASAIDTSPPTTQRRALRITLGGSASTENNITDTEPTVKPAEPDYSLPGTEVTENAGEDVSPADAIPDEDVALPIVPNSNPKVQKEFNRAAKIAQNFGCKLVVGMPEGGGDGSYQNGVITINPNCENPVMQVLLHELTHRLENSKQYGRLTELVRRQLTARNVDVEERVQEIVAQAEERGESMTPGYAMRELVAEYVQTDLFQDERAVQRLLREERSVFDVIRDWLSDAVHWLKGNRGKKRIVHAQRLFEKALRTSDPKMGMSGAQHLYAGENAATADREALARAMELERDGADAEDIRRDTGWFRGMDGKWRFEIDDSGMTYERRGGSAPGAGGLGDYIRHEGLFAAYPELRDAKVVFAEMEGRRDANYNPRTNTITINEKLRNAPEGELLHELQHAVQEIEGFASGSSRDYWEHRMEQGYSRRWSDSGLEMMPSELYRNTAGEIEARDTASRRGLDEGARRQKVPDLGGADTVFAEGTGYFAVSKDEQMGIREQLRANQELLNAMGIVGSVTTERFAGLSTGEARERIVGDMKKNGYRVDREGFGEIRFEEDEVNNSLNYKEKDADAEDARRTGFLLLKNVLKRGIEIHGHDRHKGRNYDTVTIAAPVEINGERGNMAVVVKRTRGNRYKVHRILTPSGETFKLPEMANAEVNTVGAVTNSSQLLGGSAPTINSASKNSIRADADIVNRENSPQYPAYYDSMADAPADDWRPLQKAEDVDEGAASSVAADDVTTSTQEEADPVESLPRKAREYLGRVERTLTGKLGHALSVPKGASREFLEPVVRYMSNEFLTTGRVSEETLDGLFDAAYRAGIEVEREYYDTYKFVRDHIKKQAVTISKEDQSDIPDFAQFKKSARGLVTIRNEGGLPVDTAYQELRGMAPELFPESITHPAEQLMKMHEVAQGIEKTEVSLDQYYGDDAAEFKKWAKHDFDTAVGDMLAEMRAVMRYAAEQTEKRAEAMTVSEDEVRRAYGEIRSARKAAEKAVARNLLTDYDNALVGRLLKGEIRLEDLDPRRANVKGIREVFEAKQEYEKLGRVIREYQKQRRGKLHEQADGFLGTANKWEDKPAGILYARETMERNIRDIVKDDELAKGINDTYFKPVHDSQAESNRFKNRYRERVRKLDLSRKAAEGNEVSEAYAVQLIGEAEDNIRVLEESRGRLKRRDGKTAAEWRAEIRELWEKNPELDRAKIKGAVQEFRAIYDELFQQMNEVRFRNGYEPVAYRRGYFPHFQAEDGGGLLAAFGKALGIETAVTALPTSINGITHTFRPGITWFGNAQERLGYDTVFDAVQGFDKYIEGAADVIHQTDNIQRLRALSNRIRYRASSEGIRKQVDEVMDNKTLTEDEKQKLIQQIYADGKFSLSNFVVELEEYTNILANKKSLSDRNMERLIGRRMYNVVKAMESRVAANMVAVNPGSWLTNFIPLTQASAEIGMKDLLRGMWGTLQSHKSPDGLVEQSTFLTNRRGSDVLVKSWDRKAADVMSKPMEWIDHFTADSIVRAKYEQNLRRGMSEAEALADADAFAAGVMADRSKGAMPTIFNRSDPLAKLFTQFQLEVNNQFSYLFKDIPRDMRDKGRKALAGALLKFFLGAWLYNEVYEYFVGRRPALDPIGMLNDTVGDLFGWEPPNLVELGVGAATGDLPSFRTEKKGVNGAGAALAKNAAEELPFIGSIMGGGRVPISSALPDGKKLWDAATNSDWSGKKRWSTAARELTAPVAYLAPPFGGGQAKKVLEGVEAVVRGGSYSVDKAGNANMQYPVYNDTVQEWLKSLGGATVFGKTSLPTAREWVESGFDTYNTRQTEVYRQMNDAGVSDRDAHQLLNDLQSAGDNATAKKRVLLESEISEDGKLLAYFGIVLDSNQEAANRKRDKMAAVMAEGASVDDWLEYEIGTVDLELKDDVLLFIDKMDLTWEQKDAFYRAAGYSEKTLDDAPWYHDRYRLPGP